MFVLACPVAKACSGTEHHDGRSMLQNLLTSQKSGSQGRLEESYGQDIPSTSLFRTRELSWFNPLMN